MDATVHRSGCILEPQIDGWGLVATGLHARMNTILSVLVKELAAAGISVAKSAEGNYDICTLMSSDINCDKMKMLRRLEGCMDVHIVTMPRYELHVVVAASSVVTEDYDATRASRDTGERLMDQLLDANRAGYCGVLEAARRAADATNGK